MRHCGEDDSVLDDKFKRVSGFAARLLRVRLSDDFAAIVDATKLLKSVGEVGWSLVD